MRRSAFGCGYGQQQPEMDMNYHRTHSEHVTKFAGNPCHAGGGGAAVQRHTAVHKEVDKDCYDPRQGHHQQQLLQAHRPHGYNNSNNNYGRHNSGGSHRHETYQETYEESCEEETYSAGRRHGNGHGGGARRYEYEETSYEEEEEEEVVGGGGYAQLKRGHRCA